MLSSVRDTRETIVLFLFDLAYFSYFFSYITNKGSYFLTPHYEKRSIYKCTYFLFMLQIYEKSPKLQRFWGLSRLNAHARRGAEGGKDGCCDRGNQLHDKLCGFFLCHDINF